MPHFGPMVKSSKKQETQADEEYELIMRMMRIYKWIVSCNKSNQLFDFNNNSICVKSSK